MAKIIVKDGQIVTQDGTQLKFEDTPISGTTAEFTSITAQNLYGNGSNLDNVVKTTGNQIISGIKTFNQTIGGSITGNAGTATKLQTSRSITATGDVSWTVNFDGSGNVTAAATVADYSHNHIISNIDGLQVALDSKLPVTGKAADSELLDGLDSTKFIRSDTTDTFTTLTGNNLSVIGELEGQFIGVGNTSPTSGRGISLYAGGVGGEPTYGIMFAGTSTFGTCGPVTADWATYFTMNNTANRGWIFRNTTNGTNVAAISNAGVAEFAGSVTASSFIGNITGNITGNADTATKLQTARTITFAGDVGGNFTFDGSSNLTVNTAIGAGVIVDNDINASAAIADTKLATISAAGKVSNSATTATNASIANAIVARDANGNFSAGTITAALNGHASSASTASSATYSDYTLRHYVYNASTYGNNFHIGLLASSAGYQFNYSDTELRYMGTSNLLYVPKIAVNTSDTTVGQTTYDFRVNGTAYFDGNVTTNGSFIGNLTGNITGNADTATKLQTERTITLSGDVGGSVSFDGSADVTITTTVADNSHNHIISDIDGLQVALDNKLSITGKAADSNLLDGLDSTKFIRGDINDTFTTLTGNNLDVSGELEGQFIGVGNTSSTTGYGISLYSGGVNGQPNYGIMFAGTSTFGTYGPVTSDWATYFTMNNTANRGWIFRNKTDGINVAAISNTGVAQFAGSVTASSFIGNITGNADSASKLLVNNTTSTNAHYIVFSQGNTGSVYSQYGHSSLRFFPISSTLSADFIAINATSTSVNGYAVRLYVSGASYFTGNVTTNGSFIGNLIGTADKVANLLTRGSYLTGNNYDGSAATTWAVDATTSNSGGKIVARDMNGNFSAGTITASLSGTASSAINAQKISLSDGTSLSYSFYIPLTISATSYQTQYSDTQLRYVGNSNLLYVPKIAVNGTTTTFDGVEYKLYVNGSALIDLDVTAANFIGNGSQITDISTTNIVDFTTNVRNQFSAGTDISITNGQISYTGSGLAAAGGSGQLQYNNGSNQLAATSDLKYTSTYNELKVGNMLIRRPTTSSTDTNVTLHHATNSGTANQYILKASAGGTTSLNCKSGSSVQFKVADSTKMIVNNDGNVGIGTSSPGAPLHIKCNAHSYGGLRLEETDASTRWDIYYGSSGASSGKTDNNLYIEYNGGNSGINISTSGNMTVTGTITELSTRKVKKNIRSLGSQLNKIKKLNPVSYRRKEIEDSKKEVGFISEEVKEVYPELVNGEGVNYSKMVSILVSAVKELTEKVEQQEKQIKDLKRMAR